MIHLFNNVYLRHENYFETKTASLLLRAVAREHPLARFYGMENSELPDFESILKRDYEDSIEVFWDVLLKKGADQAFLVFTDGAVMNRLLVQYWKSIFKNPTSDGLFVLYNLCVMDNKLKSYLFEDSSFSHKGNLHSDLKYLSRSEFASLFDVTKPSEVLKNADKSQMGFEILLANYFLPNNDRYKRSFEERLGEMAWRTWFEDFHILRSEILNAFYDLKRLFPEISFDFENPMDVETVILSIPQLAWILDPKFELKNMDYILRKYKKDIFIDLCKRLIALAKEKESRSQVVVDVQDFAIREMTLTELVFEEKYHEFLMSDIRDGFGCSLVNTNMYQQCNQLFPCFIYEKVRNGDVEKLKPFELL